MPSLILCAPFSFKVNNTQTISGLFSTIAGQEISVDWGDGSARSTYSGTDQAWSKDYGSAGDRTVRIFGSVVMTKFKMDAAGADISFDVANLPAGLTYLYVTGNNTLFGNIANLPTLLIDLIIEGNNILFGDIKNLPISSNLLIIEGNNTLFGNIANLPTLLTYFDLLGNNIIEDYSGKNWLVKPAVFRLVPIGAGGLSTAEIDQLFIDFDDDLAWSAGNVITLTGTNAAPSAASAAARTNIANEGCTITTN